MRKFVLPLAAVCAAVAAASPAAAQFYPQQYGYGYNGYGYGNFGEVRALQARIDSIENQIRRLDRRDRIGDYSADRLRYDAERIENRLHRAARNGLNPYDANDIRARIAQLEQRVQFSMNRYGRYERYGYGGYYGDRDDHRGYDRDDRWGHDRD